jgi:ribose transport system permease protein
MTTDEGAHGRTRPLTVAMSRLGGQDWIGPVIAVVLLSIVLALTTSSFMRPANLLTVLLQTSVIAILACGQTFAILTAGIDLSVGSVAALAATVMGVLVLNDFPVEAALLIGLAVGLGVGALQGFAVARIGIPAFIVTLGGLSIWRGIALNLTGGINQTGLPDLIRFLGGGTVVGIPTPIIVAGITFAVAGFVLRYTKFGLYVYATGGNEEGSRLSGIPTVRTKIAVYAICGFTAGLGGIVLAGRLDSAGGSFAQGYELDSIAAVVIGGTSLFGGQGTVIGTLLGAILMGIIRNGLNLLQVTQFTQMIVIGVVIVGAVAIDVIRRRPSSR